MNNMKTNQTISLITVMALSLAGSLGAKSFNFEDPKGVNNIRFDLDAPLEAISGTGNGVSGVIDFDPADPASTTGSIVIRTQSLTVPNPVMQEHLMGENWLDAANHPEIIFEAKSIDKIKDDDRGIKAHITGSLTLKGVTREITVPVTFTYLPGRLADRTNGALSGDLLVVRSSFVVERDAFGIMAGQAEDKVANDIQITLAIAGAAPDA